MPIPGNRIKRLLMYCLPVPLEHLPAPAGVRRELDRGSRVGLLAALKDVDERHRRYADVQKGCCISRAWHRCWGRPD